MNEKRNVTLGWKPQKGSLDRKWKDSKDSWAGQTKEWRVKTRKYLKPPRGPQSRSRPENLIFLFKNSLCFQNQGFLSAWNKNISNLALLFPEKSSSSFFFWLKALKKLVITIRNLRIGHWLEIWWSGSRDLFSQFGWAKRWHVSKAFFWKNEFFENQVS